MIELECRKQGVSTEVNRGVRAVSGRGKKEQAGRWAIPWGREPDPPERSGRERRPLGILFRS